MTIIKGEKGGKKDQVRRKNLRITISAVIPFPSELWSNKQEIFPRR